MGFLNVTDPGAQIVSPRGRAPEIFVPDDEATRLINSGTTSINNAAITGVTPEQWTLIQKWTEAQRTGGNTYPGVQAARPPFPELGPLPGEIRTATAEADRRARLAAQPRMNPNVTGPQGVTGLGSAYINRPSLVGRFGQTLGATAQLG